MAKIIKIDGDIIFIGMDDGGIKEVRREDINFDPQLGNKVEIFETESSTIVSQKEEVQDKKEEPQDKKEGKDIYINVNNTNQNTGLPNGYTYPSSNNTTTVVNKVAYCLFTFFLGGFGAHKFYAKKTGAGILYLIFFWTYIPFIIAFIEFIIALCKKADANGNILV